MVWHADILSITLFWIELETNNLLLNFPMKMALGEYTEFKVPIYFNYLRRIPQPFPVKLQKCSVHSTHPDDDDDDEKSGDVSFSSSSSSG